ncbi:UDP-N-acetylglucosamine 4,6-dehydratase [Oleiphilus messinensis]|uniref:UDP-N-acetylglucosamine 4,6-dehydratase n=1 Tax=Oleiphilus messinensis TaxID=141451 RepID=A0A1Y0IGF2_9GAMM|nr:UDP-N-acetylglucosamine 4,6-dehydratase [Oleiphilus messinensis]ARU59572.1 UDP-N-acetylglucosamine 4,6-dehydratase [Oleiphilus messinensis]
MISILPLIGREQELFADDMNSQATTINEIVSNSKFLVLGGAGSIGQAVTKEIFKRNPSKLHVVDISENNLVELVRDIRSSEGYIAGDFKTFALDINSIEYDALINSDGDYDYVLNLSALKHVRSEKDPFTLMRMIDVNIFNTDKSIVQARMGGASKYFCVSTDKATNPVNMMGASKRIMETFLMRRSTEIDISTARFANVAFSDGSLLHGFNQRLLKQQPIVAPNDIRRFFITPKESGELCLLSCLLGENRDIFFPKLSEHLHLLTFADIAKNYLIQRGFEPYLCHSEEEARRLVSDLPRQGKWPCLFTQSNTTGEKEYEEFFSDTEQVVTDQFKSIGIIKNECRFNEDMLTVFENEIAAMKKRGLWKKTEIVDLFNKVVPEFQHLETGTYLDSKM